jgi:hypothetical protein
MPISNVTARGATFNAEPAEVSPSDLLRRCRRRLNVVVAVRYAGISLPIAIVSSEAMALVARPGPAMVAILMAATIGMALAAALIAALAGAPSLRDAAAAVDGRLRLQDRMVTALQVSTDDDPMARLVVRDAVSRVAGLSPSQMFALEPPAHFRAIVAGAVSISLALAIAWAAASPAWRIDGARGVGSAATGGAQQGRASRPGPQQPGASAAPSAAAPRPSGAPQATAPHEAARGTEPAVGRDLGRTPAGLKAAGSRGTSPAPSAAADRDVPGSTIPAGAPAAGRGAAGEAQGAIHAAGGVKGESLRPAVSAADEPGPASPLSPAYATRYRTASARAQAAIAQERVPAGLASYVKNYFIAIRP